MIPLRLRLVDEIVSNIASNAIVVEKEDHQVCIGGQGNRQGLTSVVAHITTIEVQNG